MDRQDGPLTPDCVQVAPEFVEVKILLSSAPAASFVPSADEAVAYQPRALNRGVHVAPEFVEV